MSREIVRLADEVTLLNEKLTKLKTQLKEATELSSQQEEEHNKATVELSQEIERLVAANDELQTKTSAATAEQEILQLKSENEKLLSDQQAQANVVATLKKQQQEATEAQVATQSKQLKYDVIQRLEQAGFSYKKFVTNQVGVDFALGVAQRGDRLLVRLFDIQATTEEPEIQLVVRLMSRQLYDYRVLHFETDQQPQAFYDVEIKSAAGEKKLTPYAGACLESLTFMQQPNNGNKELLLEQLIVELKLRSISTLTGQLTETDYTQLDSLQTDLASLGLSIADDQRTINKEF